MQFQEGYDLLESFLAEPRSEAPALEVENVVDLTSSSHYPPREPLQQEGGG